MNDTLPMREQAAERIRDELVLTLRELDRRRHAAVDLRHQVQTHRTLVLELGLGVLGVAALGVVLKAWGARRAHSPEALRRKRLEGLRRAWEHPERLASPSEDRPLSEELARRILTLFILAVASRAAQGLAARVLPQGRSAEQAR